MEALNIGVIGLRKGMQHVQNFNASPDANTIAVCDSNAEKLKQVSSEYPDALACTDYKEMLGMADLDAVAVALPNHLHAPVTIDFLRAGKHVLCEKPMAMNAVEAESMKTEAEKNGLTLMLHFNMRFMSIGATLKPLVDRGRFGNIYHVNTTYTRRNGYPHPGSWFGKKEESGGGPLIDLGVHRLDLGLWLMGYPRPVSVSGANYACLAEKKLAGVDFDCEDFSAAFIRFENGASLYLASSWDAHQETAAEVTMKMYGTDAAAFEHNMNLTVCSSIGGEEEPDIEHLTPKESEETPQQHFINSIHNRTTPGPSAEHGVIIMRIIDAIYESARTGREVCFSEEEGEDKNSVKHV